MKVECPNCEHQFDIEGQIIKTNPAPPAQTGCICDPTICKCDVGCCPCQEAPPAPVEACSHSCVSVASWKCDICGVAGDIDDDTNIFKPSTTIRVRSYEACGRAC